VLQRLAEAGFPLGYDAVSHWAYEGCVHRRGAKLGACRVRSRDGRSCETWFREAHVDEIIESLKRRQAGRYELLGDDYLTLPALRVELERPGLYSLLLNSWMKRGLIRWALLPVKAAGRHDRKVYHLEDVRKQLAVPENRFDGVWQTGEGERYNLLAAARVSGFRLGFITEAIRRCPYLPEGILPSKKLKPPSASGHRTSEHTVLRQDLERLRRAVQQAKEEAAQPIEEGWGDGYEAARVAGVETITERIDLQEVLYGLRQEEPSERPPSARRLWRQRGPIWKRVWFYFLGQLQSPASTARTEPSGRKADPLAPAVVLGGSDDPVRVCGKAKPALASTAFRVVSALAAAWPAGLRKDELAQRSDCSVPHKVLRKLCTDADWNAAIELPGRGYRAGYRIRAADEV
jgi:hypothetical protein